MEETKLFKTKLKAIVARDGVESFNYEQLLKKAKKECNAAIEVAFTELVRDGIFSLDMDNRYPGFYKVNKKKKRALSKMGEEPKRGRKRLRYSVEELKANRSVAQRILAGKSDSPLASPDQLFGKRFLDNLERYVFRKSKHGTHSIVFSKPQKYYSGEIYDEVMRQHLSEYGITMGDTQCLEVPVRMLVEHFLREHPGLWAKDSCGRYWIKGLDAGEADPEKMGKIINE